MVIERTTDCDAKNSTVKSVLKALSKTIGESNFLMSMVVSAVESLPANAAEIALKSAPVSPRAIAETFLRLGFGIVLLLRLEVWLYRCTR